MWHKLKTCLFALTLVIGSAAVSGCDKDGPLEDAAEEVEDAIDDATD